MIIDPWGTVLADGGRKSGIVAATLNLSLVRKFRTMIPSLQHDRPYFEVGETIGEDETQTAK